MANKPSSRLTTYPGRAEDIIRLIIPRSISGIPRRKVSGQYQSLYYSQTVGCRSVRTTSPSHHQHLSLSPLPHVCPPSKHAYMIHSVALASRPPLYKPLSPRPPLSLPKSLAFWLRSSVVSVLHSLIAVTGLRTVKMIILIFGTCWKTSELAHVFWHSVARIALPRADANLYFFSLSFLACCGWDLKKNLSRGS